MDMTRHAVTQHLQLLEEANLVAVVWQGREKLHYLNPVPLHEIYERWIGKFERSHYVLPGSYRSITTLFKPLPEVVVE
jgi:DNA-binding transcriptional ArsR family regulator